MRELNRRKAVMAPIVVPNDEVRARGEVIVVQAPEPFQKGPVRSEESVLR